MDLSGLVSMDWWAALILLWVRRVVGRRGGTLMLASPQPSVSRMIDAAAAEAIPVYDSAGRGLARTAG